MHAAWQAGTDDDDSTRSLLTRPPLCPTPSFPGLHLCHIGDGCVVLDVRRAHNGHSGIQVQFYAEIGAPLGRTTRP